MSKYGQVAIGAAKIAKNGVSPLDAWNRSAQIVFPNGKSSREKGCPKCAFLGLADEGLIKGIATGNYTKSKENKRYAVNAVLEIFNNPNLENNRNELWELISGGNKQHNGQLDVVIGLWQNDDILLT